MSRLLSSRSEHQSVYWRWQTEQNTACEQNQKENC